jgi:CheY-like chemotaxis protein
LLITDWQVPFLSGTELVKRLRQIPAYRKLPVLMISGRAGKGDIVEAVQVGINGFLTKPFTPAQLRDKIASVWKSRNRITLDQAIQQICQGHQAFDPADDNPVILIGEATNDPAGLKRADRKDLVAYLTHLTRAIDQANKEDPDLRLGYLIETGTHDIVLRLKKTFHR